MRALLFLVLFVFVSLLSAKSVEEDSFERETRPRHTLHSLIGQLHARQGGASAESDECEDNQYFNSDESRCVACSRCGLDLYEKAACSDTRDTQCDWCLAKTPVLTEDYFQRCTQYKQMFEQLRDQLHDDLGEQLLARGSLRVSPREWTFKLAYGALILCGIVCLGLAVYWRFLRRPTVRIVQAPLLSDIDEHNIIFAAKQIRDRLTKQGVNNYEYL